MAENHNHKDFHEVGPFRDLDSDGWSLGYRNCDLCGQSACHDIWAGIRDEARWRKFFETPEMIVCEHCLPEYWKETP